mgnify:CR=1 FL=1
MSKLKVFVWMGNNIGHGKRGGRLLIGARSFNIGELVPSDLINPESLKAFVEKGCLVEHESQNDQSETIEYFAPDFLDEDQKKEFEEIKIIFSGTQEELETLRKSLGELQSSVVELSSEISDEDEAFSVLSSDAEEEEKVFSDLVKAHSINYEDAENALKASTKKLNELDSDLTKAKTALKKAKDAVKEKDESQYTEKQAEKISKAQNDVDSIESQISQTQESQTTQTQKYEASKTLLVSSQEELDEAENKNEKALSDAENSLLGKKESLSDLEQEIKDLLDVISETEEKNKNAKEKLDAFMILDQ